MSAARAVRATWLEALFDGNVAAAELEGPGNPDELLPEERSGQERWAPKRSSQFAAGRQCARLALAQLGMPPQPLVPLPDRRPAWPQGIVGSISHCDGFACAAVARQSLKKSVGVDAEIAGTVDQALWPRILSPEERAWIGQRPTDEHKVWGTIFFSAKEAFYKCQFPVLGRWLEFHDALVTLPGSPDLQGDLRLVVQSRDARLEGRGIVRDGFVVTAFSW